MGCPKDDSFILSFLYDFVDLFRQTKTQFQTACIIFKHKQILNEEMFETMLWRHLQALSELDEVNYSANKRVSSNPCKICVLPPKSMANDYIIIEAQMDLIVGMTSCSVEMSNNYSFKPIGYEIKTLSTASDNFL